MADIHLSSEMRCPEDVTKRLIEVDDDKLAEVRSLLGTRTMKATVDAALDEVLALDRRRPPRYLLSVASGTRLLTRLAGRQRGAGPYFLGDTSALTRRSVPEVAKRLDPLLETGLIARCTVTDLEAGFSSTSPRGHVAMREARGAWPFVPMSQDVLDRAVAVQDRLAERSQQRGAKIADFS